MSRMTNKFAELDRVRRLILILSGCVFALLFLLWAVIPARAWVAGLILGSAISIYNVLYLGFRIKIVSQLAMAGKRPRGLGLMHRILVVALGMVVAYQFPEWVDYRSTALGLPVGYILMIAATCATTKNKRIKREGRIVLGNHSKDSFSRSDI